MDLDELRQAVDQLIARGNGDPEASHWEEDRLMAEVLQAVAAGDPASAELAAQVLRASDRDAIRWYA